MNIKQAKQEIQNTLRAYLSKDELGSYLIPAIRQRPVLLMGPPGIGKTQIMAQIAAETGVGLVAYTITHHTRQSAIGLPFIRARGDFQSSRCAGPAFRRRIPKPLRSSSPRYEQEDNRRILPAYRPEDRGFRGWADEGRAHKARQYSDFFQ